MHCVGEFSCTRCGQRNHPMLKEILIRIVIVLGLIAFAVLRALNNVFRRS
jgi:hypothetical protein